MKDLKQVRKILKMWGSWSNNNTGCGWYTEMVGLSNVSPKEGTLIEPISDNDALVVDKLIASMYEEQNSDLISFFILSYVYNMNNCEIARQVQCSEGKIRNALILMETFISGMLSARHEMGYVLECEKQIYL